MKSFFDFYEEAIANNVGDGQIAGTVEAGDDPPVDKKKNPGLAKLPKHVRNKMGYMKKGGMVKGFKNGGAVVVKTNQKPHMS